MPNKNNLAVIPAKVAFAGMTVLVIGFLSNPLHAAPKIAGVNVPAEKVVDGQSLKLNGAGLRTATMLNINVYVASFYSPAPLTTVDQVNSSAGPLAFDFVFVRGFKKEKVMEAWTWQFEQSATHTYASFAEDRKKFIEAFGAIQKFGVETVEIIGNETHVYDAGQLRATITGRDFQKTFLSMWFGDKPVMSSLKTAFLGGAPKK